MKISSLTNQELVAEFEKVTARLNMTGLIVPKTTQARQQTLRAEILKRMGARI